MWTAQKWAFEKPRKFITSGGMGTMGFGMGAAIGAKFANPKNPVILFTGDGSFRMNLNELATIKTENLPIIVFVINNSTLGMVRQWQKLFFNKRYSATDLADIIDYEKLASGFGILGKDIKTKEELEISVKEVLNKNIPAVFNLKIRKDENVWPIVPPGDSIENQVLSE
jgi:acetolactate synthase-1/2/3 large subunit